MKLIHFLFHEGWRSWRGPQLWSPLISLLWNSSHPLISGIYLNNKFTYYLLTPYYEPGIQLSTDVFPLIFIKTLLSDHAHFTDGETKMFSNLPKVLPQVRKRVSMSAWRWSPHCGHLHGLSSHWPSGTVFLDNWSTHDPPTTVCHYYQSRKWFPSTNGGCFLLFQDI